ncbi:MAG: hypothetical protein ACO1ON_15495 [Nocardioides sp.]|uniref:hypothetical protein n=1 Tax=Nocardioides sp. TaxID=35761 RepID=UPI00261A183E|nr:hypothetical protein [Nocardioides sp.]
MTGAPSSGEVRVATRALTREAERWEDQSPRLTSINIAMANMSLSRTEAGVFQLVFDAFESLRSTMQDRAREGATEFLEIGATLRHVSDIYQQEDDAQEHVFRNLW